MAAWADSTLGGRNQVGQGTAEKNAFLISNIRADFIRGDGVCSPRRGPGFETNEGKKGGEL